MNDQRTVAIACDSADGLAGNVSGHFGHTPFFVVAEVDDGKIVSSRIVTSPGHGEGCSMPSFVGSLGVSAIIVGGIGAGAVNGLGARGIEVVAGATGNAQGALAAFAAGSLAKGEPGCGGHGHAHGGGSHGCGHNH
jgi:predicted Fe-Mo cluster-binding NifX family protein